LSHPKVTQYKEEGDYIKVIEDQKKGIDIASNMKGILPKIDKFPEDFIREGYYEIFECYYMLGDYDNAIKYLEHLIEVDDKTKELIYNGLDYYELTQKLGLFYFPVFKHNLFSKYLKAKGKIESFLKKHLNLRTKIEYVLVAIFSLMFLFYSISTLTFDYSTTNIAQNSLNYNPTYTLFLFSILISTIILLLVASLKIEKGYSKKIFDYGDLLVRNQEIESYLVKESELKKVYWILSISLSFTCICLTLPFTTWFADISINLTKISIYYITEGTFLVFLLYSIIPLIFVFVFLLSPFILFIYSSLTISVLKDFISSTYRNLTGRTIHESELLGYGYFVIIPSYGIGGCLIIFSVIFVITLEKPTHVTHFLAPVSLSIFLFIFILNWVYQEFTVGSNKLIGDTYYSKEKYKEACDRYKKIEKHVNNKFYKTVFPPSDTFLSNLYMAYGDSKFRLGEREEALTLLNKSLEYAEKGNLTSYLWQIHYKIGQIKEEENKLEGAYENYKKSIEIIEDLRELVKIPERKEAFFENKAEVYAKMVVLCLRLGKDEEAFNYAERAKGRVFLERTCIFRIIGNRKGGGKSSSRIKRKRRIGTKKNKRDRG
jgi:tetratricopeptide (TPR) repeat protein